MPRAGWGLALWLAGCGTEPSAPRAPANEVPAKVAPAPAEVPPASAPAAPSLVSFTFSSDPPEVEIYLDGAFVGVTPTTLRYPQDERTVEVVFKKDGYREAKQTLSLSRGAPVIARLAPTTGKSARPKPKTQ